MSLAEIHAAIPHREPFLLVDGILQNQDGVTSVKAERLHALGGAAVEIDSHDFH